MITGSPVSRKVGAFGYQQAMLAGSVAPRPFSPFGDVDLASRSYEIHAWTRSAVCCGAKVTIALEVYSGARKMLTTL